MDKMNVYKQLATPPADALKTIGGGRLKGMTDIKPQWRLEKMTEVFGPCGIGWRYEITRQWTEQGDSGQVLAFCNINLYYKYSGQWSEAIPGTGGNMLITKESKGLYSSDEAYKMALTDAISVAMKSIGMAADIYRGAGIDSKYAHSDDNTPPNITNTTPQPKRETTPDKASVLGDCIKLIKNSGLDEATMATLRKKYAEVKTAEQAEKFKVEVEKLIMVQSKLGDVPFEDDDIPWNLSPDHVPLM